MCLDMNYRQRVRQRASRRYWGEVGTCPTPYNIRAERGLLRRSLGDTYGGVSILHELVGGNYAHRLFLLTSKGCLYCILTMA